MEGESSVISVSFKFMLRIPVIAPSYRRGGGIGAGTKRPYTPLVDVRIYTAVYLPSTAQA